MCSTPHELQRSLTSPSASKQARPSLQVERAGDSGYAVVETDHSPQVERSG